MTTTDLSKNNELNMKRLLENGMGINAEIKTYDNHWQGKWCVYNRLGIIAPRMPSWAITGIALSQYDTRGGQAKVLLRKIARLVYLNSMGLLADKSLDISAKHISSKNIFFWWRGRSMRLYDMDEQSITYTVKEGITNKFLEKILYFRQKYKHDFLIELIDSGDDWYKEPIIQGKTLAMYQNKTEYNALLKRSIISMKQIAQETVVFKDPHDYVGELTRKINANIAALPANIANYDVLKKIVNNLRIKSQQLDKPVPVVLAHCDLHPQNILIDQNNKIYLIDWEAYDFRSIWYDPAVLLLEFRRSAGINNMLLNYNHQNIIDAVLVNDEQKSYNMESVMSILIMENILGKTIIAKELKQGAGTVLHNFVEYFSHISWYQNL